MPIETDRPMRRMSPIDVHSDLVLRKAQERRDRSRATQITIDVPPGSQIHIHYSIQLRIMAQNCIGRLVSLGFPIQGRLHILADGIREDEVEVVCFVLDGRVFWFTD